MSKHFLSLSMLIAGLLGTLVCISVIIATWILSGRINQTTVNVFTTVEETLDTVQRRLKQTQSRVQELKITTEGIKQNLESWTKQEARERVTAKLGIEERSARLAAGLQQADQWLEFTESSVQIAQHALNFGNSKEDLAKNPRIATLQSELLTLRTQLAEAIQAVENIHSWAAGTEIDAAESRFQQIISLAVRVLATFGTIDAGLNKLNDLLANLQTEARNTKKAALWWVRVGAIVMTLLALWMLAGQYSMCSLGRKRLRERDSE